MWLTHIRGSKECCPATKSRTMPAPCCVTLSAPCVCTSDPLTQPGSASEELVISLLVCSCNRCCPSSPNKGGSTAMWSRASRGYATPPKMARTSTCTTTSSGAAHGRECLWNLACSTASPTATPTSLRFSSHGAASVSSPYSRTTSTLRLLAPAATSCERCHSARLLGTLG